MMVGTLNVQMFLLWCACHFLADFPLQGDYLSSMKGKSWEHLFYHCAEYTGVFVIFAHPLLWACAALFAPHFLIDALKARYKVIPWLWLDQLLHILTIVVILEVLGR
jgi:hypothetical protein